MWTSLVVISHESNILFPCLHHLCSCTDMDSMVAWRHACSANTSDVYQSGDEMRFTKVLKVTLFPCLCPLHSYVTDMDRMVAWIWRHTCNANTKQVLLSCNIATIVVVKWGSHWQDFFFIVLVYKVNAKLGRSLCSQLSDHPFSFFNWAGQEKIWNTSHSHNTLLPMGYFV